MGAFSIIAAIGCQGQIGLLKSLPRGQLKRDMLFFRHVTHARDPREIADVFMEGAFVITNGERVKSNAVIMGRKTWESLPQPLSDRANIIVSSRLVFASPIDTTRHVSAAADFQAALWVAGELRCPNTFVIGGAQVYGEALAHPECERLYLTEVDYHGHADVWWPGLTPLWQQGELWSDDGEMVLWTRQTVSGWMAEPERPAYRFGIWEKAFTHGTR